MSACTLRSLQLSARTPDPDCVATKVHAGASTPEYVKRTARLFESSEGTILGNQSPKCSTLENSGKRVSSSKNCDVLSVVVVNGNKSQKTGENLINGDGFSGKKPSYLGLACSVSGYSGITTYDSKLREGFRSRDHSPGRLGIIKSRDVSPSRQGSDHFEIHHIPTYKSDCGNFLVAPPAKTNALLGVHIDKVESISHLNSGSGKAEAATPGSGSTNISPHSGGNHMISHVNGNKLGQKENKIQSPQFQRKMEGGGKFTSTVHHSVNGVSEKLGITSAESNYTHLESSRYVGSYSGSSKEEFFSDTASNIRESTRNFMSSMLMTESSVSSAHYESSVIQTAVKSRDVTDFSSPHKNSPLTSVPREGFGVSPPIRCSPESPKTSLRYSPCSHATSSARDNSSQSSPLKHSPDSPRTSSKDSLMAPTTVSPQKRSPGAVRVVEFTSQAKSYVRTAFVSTNSMECTSTYKTQGYSDSPQLKGPIDGAQTSYMKSVHTGLTTCGLIDSDDSSDAITAQTHSSDLDNTVWATKSFIQQRVERLYGPGALAQGFFRRTQLKLPDAVQVTLLAFCIAL